MQDLNCIFCKIAKGEIDHCRIYEDEKTIAFLDISPASPRGGHTLVIPKEHYVEITDVPDDVLVALAKTMKKVAKALKTYFKCDLNILQNNGKFAGQYVMHAHFHLIPRFEKDGIEIEKWKPQKYKPREMEVLRTKIKKLL